jgi:hypothetical protein
MEIPARSTHKYVLDESNFPFKFKTSVCAIGRYVFPYFDFMNEGLFEYGCEDSERGMQSTTSGTTRTLRYRHISADDVARILISYLSFSNWYKRNPKM